MHRPAGGEVPDGDAGTADGDVTAGGVGPSDPGGAEIDGLDLVGADGDDGRPGAAEDQDPLTVGRHDQPVDGTDLGRDRRHARRRQLDAGSAPRRELGRSAAVTAATSSDGPAATASTGPVAPVAAPVSSSTTTAPSAVVNAARPKSTSLDAGTRSLVATTSPSTVTSRVG